MLQCYLHSDMDLDINTAARAHNWQPDRPVYPTNPAVRYTVAVPIMFESGTKYGNALPEELYGCPYPPAADGTCQVPSPANLTATWAACHAMSHVMHACGHCPVCDAC